MEPSHLFVRMIKHIFSQKDDYKYSKQPYYETKDARVVNQTIHHACGKNLHNNED